MHAAEQLDMQAVSMANEHDDTAGFQKGQLNNIRTVVSTGHSSMAEVED